MEAEDESGIEGILNRLEGQRNLAFGFESSSKDDRHLGNTIDAVS